MLGRAEDVADAADPLRAEAVARRERNLLLDRRRRGRIGLGDRLDRRVPHRRGRSELPELLANRRRPGDIDDSQRGLGQGACLVEADDVDGGERLDRVQLLRQRAPPRHPQRRDRVGQACEQDQPLRDERHDRGDGGRHRGVQGRVPVPERVAEDDAERDHHRDEYEQELVQGALERRARMAEGSRLARQAVGVAVRPDRGHCVGADSLDRERPGAHCLARLVRNGLRLAGEDRLVDAQRFRLLERAVGHDLVARADPDEIADDELLRLGRPVVARRG